jgi:hypothetical protein
MTGGKIPQTTEFVCQVWRAEMEIGQADRKSPTRSPLRIGLFQNGRELINDQTYKFFQYSLTGSDTSLLSSISNSSLVRI